MPDLNKQQEDLLPYIERYRELVKEVGDSITDYQARCGEPYVITPKEHDFLTFQFYPSLQTLDKFLPIELARDIRQIIHNARPVLSSIFGEEDYEKYKDGSLALQDLQKLVDAFTAAGKILEPTKPTASGKAGEIKNQQPAETQIFPIDTVIDVLDDCIGRIHDWFECKGIRPEYSIRNARNEAIKIQEKLKGIGTPAGEPDFAKALEEIRRQLSDYKNEQINRRLQVIEKRVVDIVTFTDYPNASSPDALLGNMKEELEGLRADLVCWTGEKNQADLKPAEAGGNATPATIINIDKLGVLGNIQAENVQTGDHSSIHKQTITGEKNKSIIWKILKIIGAIAALLTILNYLGWLEPIKALLLLK